MSIAELRPHLAFRGITVVLDVGAHEGQFAKALRVQAGFSGRIISFEPQPDVFERLQERAAADGSWECHRLALGSTRRRAELNTTANSWSSSLLRPTERSIALEAGIEVTHRTMVHVARLDTLGDRLRLAPGDRVLLKIDAQGFEERVLAGARGLDRHFALLQLELPFFETYVAPRGKGAWLASEALPALARRGWRVIEVLPGWRDRRTGELLEADFLFARDTA